MLYVIKTKSVMKFFRISKVHKKKFKGITFLTAFPLNKISVLDFLCFMSLLLPYRIEMNNDRSLIWNLQSTWQGMFQ